MSKSKAKAVPEGPPPLLGRVGTSLKVGIVGLPNVGYVIHDYTLILVRGWAYVYR